VGVSSDRAGGARRAMLLAGAPLARAGGASTETRDCERRDRQLDGPNAPGWAAHEERAATSVRRAGGEATLRALLTRRVPNLVTLRGGRRPCDELEFLRRAAQSNFS
jgi:hypothetical protein